MLLLMLTSILNFFLKKKQDSIPRKFKYAISKPTKAYTIQRTECTTTCEVMHIWT